MTQTIPYNWIKEAMDLLVEDWGENGKKIIELTFSNEEYRLNMTGQEFLQHCTACGGNWGGMLLTGIKELAPAIYDTIPENMGCRAWVCIISTLRLMKVEF